MKQLKMSKPRIFRTIADNAILFIWIIFLLASCLFVQGFFRGYNLKNYVINSSVLFIAACGLTFPTLNGGVDFSMTAIVSLVSTVSAYLMVSTSLAGTILAIPVAILVSLILGGIIGAVNGISVSRFKMPSFVVTLSTMLVFSGFAVWFGSVYYEKVSLGGLPANFTALGGSGSFWLWPVIIAATIFLFSHWLLTKTLFGRRVYAVGINPKTAAISGIPVKSTIFMLFLICGVYSAIAGLLYTAKNGAGVTSLGEDMFIDFVGAVVIGGTSPFGGHGSVKQTLYGVLFIVLISNVLNLLGVHYTMYDVVKGGLILLAAALELACRRMKAKAAILATEA